MWSLAETFYLTPHCLQNAKILAAGGMSVLSSKPQAFNNNLLCEK
jgi:hypothetical protein